MKKNQIKFKFLLLGPLFFACFISLSPAQTKPESPGSFSFAFLADIHLDYSSLKYFDSAIVRLNKINPDFILTGGDNVKDAARQRESYADSLFNLYLSRIKKFNMPVYTGIGNHEVFGVGNAGINPENPMYGKKMYESKVGKRYYSFSHKGWKFFMIDDIKNADKGPRYTGYVDDEQMEWLKTELAATDSKTPIVICAHIPFISSMKKFELGSLSGNPENDGVANSIEFFRLFAHHNLKLLLQGHFHFFEVLFTNNIYYITGPSVNEGYGSSLTKTNGMFLFDTKGDNIAWRFIENN